MQSPAFVFTKVQIGTGPIGLPTYRVGRDGEGHWLAVETHGLGGGLFASRDAALRYARAETGRRPGAVEIAMEPIRLG